MKKQLTTLSLCIILTACGGGSGGSGPAGAPGKSAYDIWLSQGNTGTEQDFLDSLVGSGNTVNSGTTGENNNTSDMSNNEQNTKYYANIKEYIEDTDWLSLYNETTENWAKHGNYKRYEVVQRAQSSTQTYDVKHVYNEKELNLGNYGVYAYLYQYDFDTTFKKSTASAYIHNREGIGANVYTPTTGSVFHGGTLAYLHTYSSHNTQNAELIKGDATFTYDPINPVLNLAFDNYYNLTFTQQTDGKYTVDIAGTNTTGNTAYNLPTGTFANKTLTMSRGHVSKNGIEESFGTYSEDFRDYEYGNAGRISEDFTLTGAYGGTK